MPAPRSALLLLVVVVAAVGASPALVAALDSSNSVASEVKARLRLKQALRQRLGQAQGTGTGTGTVVRDEKHPAPANSTFTGVTEGNAEACTTWAPGQVLFAYAWQSPTQCSDSEDGSSCQTTYWSESAWCPLGNNACANQRNGINGPFFATQPFVSTVTTVSQAWAVAGNQYCAVIAAQDFKTKDLGVETEPSTAGVYLQDSCGNQYSGGHLNFDSTINAVTYCNSKLAFFVGKKSGAVWFCDPSTCVQFETVSFSNAVNAMWYDRNSETLMIVYSGGYFGGCQYSISSAAWTCVAPTFINNNQDQIGDITFINDGLGFVALYGSGAIQLCKWPVGAPAYSCYDFTAAMFPAAGCSNVRAAGGYVYASCNYDLYAVPVNNFNKDAVVHVFQHTTNTLITVQNTVPSSMGTDLAQFVYVTTTSGNVLQCSVATGCTNYDALVKTDFNPEMGGFPAYEVFTTFYHS